MSVEIDYKQLLIKYIRHVGKSEGCDFIPSQDQIGWVECGDDELSELFRYKDYDLTLDELKELNNLSR